MTTQIPLELETFGYEPEPEFEFPTLELKTSGPPPGANRNSAAYTRWVQGALNRAMGLKLAEDGIGGPATRSAIRSFQKGQGLVVDGIVGPRTATRLRRLTASSTQPATSSRCPPTPVFVDCPPRACSFGVLNGFGFDVAEVDRARHSAMILRVARTVRDSLSSPFPISTITLAGHTDAVGDDDYNFVLSRRRAESVMRTLCSALERMVPGSTRGISFQIAPCGERHTLETAEMSRRVEIFLGAKPSRQGARTGLFGGTSQQARSGLDGEIDTFCKHTLGWRPIPPPPPKGSKKKAGILWCGDAVSQLMVHLAKGAPKNNLNKPPFLNCTGAGICAGNHTDSSCAPNTSGDGRYFIVDYKQAPMAAAVEKLKCALDRGLVVRVGVMSGVCADKPDITCKLSPSWRECPEHYILVFGHEGDRFAFWDFSRASSRGDCGVTGEIGILTWDRTTSRLSTAANDSDMKVNKVANHADSSGFHVSLQNQKRYQVLSMVSGPYRQPVRNCQNSPSRNVGRVRDKRQ